MNRTNHYDVVIIGAGLAGLSLSRHLLLDTDKKVLLVERRDDLPGPQQKVGESTVQLAGYYFSRVLDLEETLLKNHLLKYNLRFYWKSAGRDNSGFEDYSQVYYRAFSNICSYQIDRNAFEAELLQRNRQSQRFTFLAPTADLEIDLAAEGSHRVKLRHGDQPRELWADWVVDTTGRNRLLAGRMKLRKPSPIRHAASFFWVEGLVNIEKLTGRSLREMRVAKERSATGHTPFWLATNHFCAEGMWFWVIPLRDKTSFGLVYDRERLPFDHVPDASELIDWICREFPLFRHQLSQRRVLGQARLRDFAFDCTQTIHAQRWALAGESGRFTDPLYSPGSDLIATYNTLIVDAIRTEDRDQLAAKCSLYEQLMRALYEAYVPAYVLTYDALGDPEVFALKYLWELSIYFGFYVFPFINDLLTDARVNVGYLRRFAKLGPINRSLQRFLRDYYHWKRDHLVPGPDPLFFDLSEVGPLRTAEKTFYEVEISPAEAKATLDAQLANLEQLATFIVSHIYAVVVGDRAVLSNRRLIDSIELERLSFDPEAMRQRWVECAASSELFEWNFDAGVLERFQPGYKPILVPAAAQEGLS